jgi:hypothetical protein
MPATTATADPYAELLELARQERAVVITGDWEAVHALQDLQEELRAQLPARPPAHARTALTEAARLNAETVRIVERGLEGVRAQISDTARGREAAAGYGAAAVRVPRLAWEG